MSPLVMQALTILVPLVGGYLLRHYNVSLPGLPSPTSSPLPVSLKDEMVKLLKDAAQNALKEVLKDVQTSQPAQANQTK